MNDIFRTLDRMRFEHNLTDRQKHIIGATLEHIEHEKNQECKNCVHFREEKQPDGLSWENCTRHFDCTIPRLNHFEARKEDA